MVNRVNAVLQRLMWVPLLVLVFSTFVGLATILYWANDDSPPFVNGPYDATPTKAGHGMPIKRWVRRDLSRQCSITYTRWLFDSADQIHDITIGQDVSPEMRAVFEKQAPGRRDEVVHIPAAAAPGRARIVSDLNYHCNPWQKWRPINIRSELLVEILPP